MIQHHIMHATLSDIIADTVQNSIEAGAKLVKLEITEDAKNLAVRVTDNGKGMDESTLVRVFNPFYTEAGKHDRRKVGLGLPILKQMCDATGGEVSLKSEPGRGTELFYSFPAKHIDLPPMGDLPGTLLSLFNYPGAFELEFTHKSGKEEYSIARSELIEAVGELECASTLALAKEFLESQENSLKGE